MGSIANSSSTTRSFRGLLNNRTLIGVLAIIAASNLIVFGLQRWVALPMPVASDSMRPALREGSWILVRRNHASADALARRIDRGDVLVFRAPHEGRPLVVKRVIGLPGETVQAKAGPIAINNSTSLVEKWLPEDERRAITIKPTHLGADEVYVLGDNRDGSIDSRSFGAVKLDDVVGTVAVRFWPLSDFGPVDFI